MEFDLNWRMEWEKEKLGVHPRYHKDLPLCRLRSRVVMCPNISVLKEVRRNGIGSLFA